MESGRRGRICIKGNEFRDPKKGEEERESEREREREREREKRNE